MGGGGGGAGGAGGSSSSKRDLAGEHDLAADYYYENGDSDLDSPEDDEQGLQ